jgi:hypothetical protein
MMHLMKGEMISEECLLSQGCVYCTINMHKYVSVGEKIFPVCEGDGASSNIHQCSGDAANTWLRRLMLLISAKELHQVRCENSRGRERFCDQTYIFEAWIVN